MYIVKTTPDYGNENKVRKKKTEKQIKTWSKWTSINIWIFDREYYEEWDMNFMHTHKKHQLVLLEFIISIMNVTM